MKRPLGMFIPLILIGILSSIPVIMVIFMTVSRDIFVQDAPFFIFSIAAFYFINIVGVLLSLSWSKAGVVLLGVSIFASVLVGFLVWAFTIVGFFLFYISLALPMLYFIALYPVMQNWQYFK